MNCENCGQEFEATQRTRRFCSEKCRKQAERRRHYEKHHLNHEQYKAPCKWCGKLYDRAGSTCSNKCSQDRNRYRAYGVHSLQQLDEMKARAGGRCEICGIHEKDAPKGVLHCDHDHETRQPRGMLCMHCNQGLGHFRDDVAVLNRASEYLSRKISNEN